MVFSGIVLCPIPIINGDVAHNIKGERFMRCQPFDSRSHVILRSNTHYLALLLKPKKASNTITTLVALQVFIGHQIAGDLKRQSICR